MKWIFSSIVENTGGTLKYEVSTRFAEILEGQIENKFLGIRHSENLRSE